MRLSDFGATCLLFLLALCRLMWTQEARSLRKRLLLELSLLACLDFKVGKVTPLLDFLRFFHWLKVRLKPRLLLGGAHRHLLLKL